MTGAAENEADHVAIGTVLAGKYRVDKILGQGGMGFVVAATHLQMDEPVAMKFLHAAVAKQADLVARFQREAKAARKIRSEHVVRILDVGALENGAPFLIMEYLEGTDLDRLIRTEGPRSVADGVDYLLQACEALAEAHVQGMVHRDLKPANLFVARRADNSALVKVLDFGISKVTGADGADLGMTKTNSAVLGSPLYMAPEQMRSLRGVDARTDIWSLGVILHEMLAGVPPYHATTLPELCASILQDPPPPIRERRRDVPEGLAHALARCMEKDPAKRFPDVAALAEAIAPFGTGAGKASAERIAGVFRAHQPERAVVASSPPPKAISAMAQTDVVPPSIVDPIGATRPLASTDGPVAARSEPPPKERIGAGTTGKAWATNPPAAEAVVPGTTGPQPRNLPPRKKGYFPLVFGGAVVLGAIVLVVGLTQKGKHDGANAIASSNPTASVIANAPPSTLPTATATPQTVLVPIPPPEIPAPDKSVAPAKAVPAVPNVPGRTVPAVPTVPVPVAVNAPPPTPVAPPAKPAYCEKSPKWFDDAGDGHWKKECLDK